MMFSHDMTIPYHTPIYSHYHSHLEVRKKWCYPQLLYDFHTIFHHKPSSYGGTTTMLGPHQIYGGCPFPPPDHLRNVKSTASAGEASPHGLFFLG